MTEETYEQFEQEAWERFGKFRPSVWGARSVKLTPDFEVWLDSEIARAMALPPIDLSRGETEEH